MLLWRHARCTGAFLRSAASCAILRHVAHVHKLPCRNQESKAKEKGEGMKDDVKGNVKEGFGKLTGDDSKQAEGKADQAKGDGKKETAGIL